MLSRITGTLAEIDPPPGNSGLLAPEGMPGLAYEVLLPGYLAERLRTAGGGGGEGATVTLWVIEYLESQNQGASFIPRLIGFASARERAFFELLTSVKGLGNKRALRAMAVPPATIARAIAERDARRLQTLPEIGPKLAELIVHELKSKVDGFVLEDSAEAQVVPTAQLEPKGKVKPRVRLGPGGDEAARGATNGEGPSIAGASPSPPIRQTVDALVALGESPMDAERMVSRAIDKARAGGAMPKTTQELLTAAYAAR